MKKIFTFFIAMVVTLSMYAVIPNTLGEKVDPTGRATELASKQQAHRQQMAKALGLNQVERTAAKVAPKANNAPKKAQNEVITLNYDGFAGLMCVDAELGVWWVGMGCDDESRPEYGHNLQLQWQATPNNPCGTFTTEVFEYDYTHLMTPTHLGSILFEEVTMTLTHEKVNANLERYVLEATLLSEEGDTYLVHAVHENIVAKSKVDIYIENATMTQEAMRFTVEGKNDDLEIKLVVKNDEFIGIYNKGAIDWENSKITHKGATVAPITFKAIVNLASHTETGELAYVTEINMMGNDTIDYHMILAAPLPAPTDIIELTAIDLKVDDSYAMYLGSVDFYATTPEFSIRGGWQDDFAEEGTYDAAIFLDAADMSTITSLQAEVTVTLGMDNNWAIEGTMLGSDNKIYNLHLTRTVPKQTDTVIVAFDKSAKAYYYPYSDYGTNDIQLYNEDGKFKVSINVTDIELGDQFDEEYIIASYTYLEAKDNTKISVAEIVNGKLYQVGDTTKIEADFVTFQGVLYQVRLWYVAPTPTAKVNLDIKNAEFIIDLEYNMAYNLVGYSADSSYMFVFTAPAESKEDIPGTFENDGKFGKFGEGKYEFDATTSYVAVWDTDIEYYNFYYIQKGKVVVTMDTDDNITLTASVVCEDAIQYEVTLTSKYEEPHIDYDAEEGAVERVYGPDTELTINDRTQDYGLIYLQLTDIIQGDVTAVYFVMSEPDNETVLPLGTYEINSTWLDGTVTASIGMQWDDDGMVSVIPSYYAGYAEGYLVGPYYFFQTGTVVVDKDDEGKWAIEINAVNSCGIPVHIVYGNVPSTGVENINMNAANAIKKIVDGRLLIIRDGKAYNAVGVQVK